MAQDTWSKATFGLSIASLVCSLICAIITSVCIYKDRIPRAQIWFRLSLSISLATIVSSVCCICTRTEYMNTRPPMQLRAILWLSLASELFMSLLTTCVVVHVLLTIATMWTKLAHRVQKWYDIGSLSVALIVTHPVLYVGRLVEWDRSLHTIRIDDVWMRKWHAWVVFLAWISLSIVINVCLISVVTCKMLKYDTLSASKQDMEHAVHSNLDGHLDALCQIRKARRRVQLVALRLSCYALVPLVTQVWTIACAMSNAIWLFNWAPVMASTQGIIFLCLLAVNPACDELWLTLFSAKQQCVKHEQLRLDFAQLDASTIHLSPYQSRSSMTV